MRVYKDVRWLFRQLSYHVINGRIEKMERAGDKQKTRSGCVLPVSRKLKLLFTIFRGKAPPLVRPLGKVIYLPDKMGRKMQIPLIAIK
jgi:hypothetical protein